MLREARRAAGWSQRQLAARSGVASTLISAYENGRRQCGADVLLLLLEAAGYDLELVSSVERSRPAAQQLEQVCAMAMALPRRRPGPLRFPPVRTLTS